MKAVRISTAAFGTLCGLTGILAGIYLILQGNSPADAGMISYIGPDYLMWEHHTYRAYTLIPNYLYSGITTLIISSLLTYWSLFRIHKSYGSTGFLALSILQLLTGGGFVIDLALITFFLSLAIRGKPDRWRRIFPNKRGKLLAVLWLPSVILYAGLSVLLLVLTIAAGNHPEFMNIMEISAGLMFIPILLMVGGCLAYDGLRSYAC